MTTRQCRVLAAVSCGLWLLLVAALCLKTWRVWQQRRQDEALILALSGKIYQAGTDLTRAKKIANKAFFRAVQHNDVGTVTAMLNDGIDPNIRETDADYPGQTALVVAVETEYMDEGSDYPGSSPRNVLGVVRALLAHGADVRLECADGGTTALSVAYRHASNDLLRLLEDEETKRIGINGRGVQGRTTLRNAVSWSDYFKIRSLLAHHADPNIADDIAFTPLHEAARNGNVEAIKLLLAHGARLDAQDADGRTPLMYAVQQEYVERTEVEAVKELIRAGANVNIKSDYKNQTALSLASACENRQVMKVLRDAGAKP